MQRRILLIFLFVITRVLVEAQPGLTLPNYRQYTLRDGLSQMQVTCMYHDSRGYMWIGTKAGLNCFNGEKIVSYTSSNHPELADDYIYSLKEDDDGRIWGSSFTGIFCFDGTTIQYYQKPGWSDIKLAPDRQGRIWYLARSSSSFHFGYIRDGKFYSWDDKLPSAELSVSTDLICTKPDNQLLFSLGSVLYRLNGGRAEKIYQNPVNIVLIPENQGKCFFSDSDDIKNFRLLSYTMGHVEVIATVKDGAYLTKPALSEVLCHKKNLIHPVPIALTPDTIMYDFVEGLQVNSVLFDHDGNLWVGSEEGFYQLFGHGFTAYKKELLPQVWAITEDQQGSLWFSSFMFGLSKLEKGKLRKYPELAKRNIDYFYFHPSVDKRGRIFFPNAYGMLMAEGGHFRQFNDKYYITTYYDDENDLLWTGTKKQAVAYNSDVRKIKTIGEAEGLDVGNNVLCIGKDSFGCYWFGGGKGIARYNLTTGKLKNFNPLNLSPTVVCVCKDYKGRSWFGSDQGLLWYNAKTDSFEQLKCEELSGAVNMVNTIDSTWLIASQPYGIYLVDLQEYYRTGKIKLNLFNEKNGFTGVEPGQDGAFKGSDGRIWMATSTELIVLDPKKLKFSNYSLHVRIVKFNDKRLPFKAGFIELPANQNSVVVTFEAICFNRPNPVEYSWKLANDTAWSAWQTEDYTVISGLKDGTSKITVRARVKGLPLPDASQATMDIRVRMAVYRQPWFFPSLFAFISFIGISLLVIMLLKMKKASREAKMFQIQAIQSQMNPHFIFNVLASIQSMILKANIPKANDYLVKLADLIRGFLEASAGTGVLKSPLSNEGLVSIGFELSLIKEFVDFQQLINPDRFDFEVQIAENIDPLEELIPPMLLQPFVENSIRHGLLPSTNKGKLNLSFRKTEEFLIIEILDNGVGIEKARQLIKNSPMRYNSRGSELTMNRIKLINQLGFRIEVNTASNREGTSVIIKLYK